MSGRLLAVVVSILGLGPIGVAAIDNIPPEITHTPIEGTRTQGTPAVVEATVTDASSVYVVLFYRTSGEPSFHHLSMSSTGADVYSAEIPATSVIEPGAEYYITAIDAQGNGATSPAGAPTSVYTFHVLAPMGDDVVSNGGVGCGVGGGGAWALAGLGLLALRRRRS